MLMEMIINPSRRNPKDSMVCILYRLDSAKDSQLSSLMHSKHKNHPTGFSIHAWRMGR